MSALHATDATLPALLEDGVSVVDFWATWCQPCKAMAPIVDELAGELAGRNVKVVKADIEQAPNTARHTNVRSVPTFAIVKDGKILSAKSGQMPKAAFKAWIDDTLSGHAA